MKTYWLRWCYIGNYMSSGDNDMPYWNKVSGDNINTIAEAIWHTWGATMKENEKFADKAKWIVLEFSPGMLEGQLMLTDNFIGYWRDTPCTYEFEVTEAP